MAQRADDTQRYRCCIGKYIDVGGHVAASASVASISTGSVGAHRNANRGDSKRRKSSIVRCALSVELLLVASVATSFLSCRRKGVGRGPSRVGIPATTTTMGSNMLRFPSPPLNLIGVLVVLLLLCGVFVGSAHSYKAWDDSGVGFRPTPRQGAGGTLNKADGLEICNKVRWSTKIPQSYCSNYHSQLPGSATEQECLDACGPDCTAVSYHPDVEFCYIVRGACRHRGHDAFYTFVKEPACDEESEAVAESRVLMLSLIHI